MPKVTVLVLNYKGRKLLEKFFPFVRQIDYPNQEILVVDGGSRDGSLEYLSQFPDVRVVDQGNIPGAGHAVNVGVREAKGDLVLYIGNDMRPDPRILRFLVPPMISDPKIGVCCPKILTVLRGTEPSDVIDHVGLALDRYGFPKPIGFGEHDKGQYDALDSSWFAGGEALIRKGPFVEVGGFDESYRVMAEDIDFCWRLRLHGYKIALEPRAVIYHNRPLEHETTMKRYGRERIRYFVERNTERMLVKNYSTSTLISMFGAYSALFTSEVIFFLLMRRLDLFRADVAGLLDNIKDFRFIWAQHVRVQRTRRVPDHVILSSMSRRTFKLEILQIVIRSLS